MFLEGRRADPEQRLLGAVAIADQPVAEAARAAGNVGERLRDPAARAGLCNLHRLAGSKQLADKCLR